MDCSRAPRSTSVVGALALIIGAGGLAGCGAPSSGSQSASSAKVDCSTFQVDRAAWRALIDAGGDSPAVTRRGQVQVHRVVECKTLLGLSPQAVESEIGIVADSVNQWGNSRDEPVMFWSDGDTGIEVHLNDAKTQVRAVVPLTVEPD